MSDLAAFIIGYVVVCIAFTAALCRIIHKSKQREKEYWKDLK